jgi:hypothetical protein
MPNIATGTNAPRTIALDCAPADGEPIVITSAQADHSCKARSICCAAMLRAVPRKEATTRINLCSTLLTASHTEHRSAQHQQDRRAADRGCWRRL